jgi:concentrative nucleoside transporter, CNT family
MARLISFSGVFVILALAYLMSNRRSAINFKLVVWGMILQFGLALIVLGIPALGVPGPLRFIFDAANDVIIEFVDFTLAGSKFLFGPLAEVKSSGFIFAVQVLPTILFVAAIMSILYHLGVMQKIVKFFAIIMQKTLNTSGAESLAAAANIFVGQTEAPLIVKPYIGRMTNSELFAVMVPGMASVAGGVMAAYVGLLRDKIPDIAGHLLTASVMSAPAALVIAKIMIPETKKSETLGEVPEIIELENKPANVIEAAAVGTIEGLQLALNVGAMLLVFIALTTMFDAMLGYVGGLIGFAKWGHDLVPAILLKGGEAHLSFSLVLGWLFSPLAWFMGIPWSEASMAGALLGEKLVLNEFVAYLHLSENFAQMSDRTAIILSYALCGFANFSSIGIQIGGIGSIAPHRRSDLARLGVRCVIGGSLATFMMAAIAGIFI